MVSLRYTICHEKIRRRTNVTDKALSVLKIQKSSTVSFFIIQQLITEYTLITDSFLISLIISTIMRFITSSTIAGQIHAFTYKTRKKYIPSITLRKMPSKQSCNLVISWNFSFQKHLKLSRPSTNQNREWKRSKNTGTK